MTRVILTTVGTSLKNNAGKAGRSPAELLRENPRAACAEVNVLDRLLEPGDAVELFHSQTPDGQCCAEDIATWVRGRGHTATVTEIEGLTYQKQDFHRGLRSLVRLLAGRIRAVMREGRNPILNALGGFKSEVAYATLVGALFGIPNRYIHEGYDDLEVIPPLPVGWDIARIDAYADTLQYLDDGPHSLNEAHSRLAALPNDLRDSLTETVDDLVDLSPLGKACFEAYRARVESATDTLYLSRDAAKTYDDMEPSVREAFDRALQRLRIPEIRRQQSKTLERDRGDVLVFLRGDIDERLFYFEEEDNAVRVVAMTRHGREYDRLYRQGVFKNDFRDHEWRVCPISSR